MNRRIIIPAAGKGSRLITSENAPPKVMHCVGGRPLLQVVLEQTDFIPPQDTYIVVGYKKEQFFYLEEKYGARLEEILAWKKAHGGK